MKTIQYYLISLMLLMVHIIVAQPDTSLGNSTTHQGAGWGSNGGYTTFGMAGQYIQGQVAGGDYTGRIGYLLGDLAVPEENLPPVASAPTQRFYYELGETMVLNGYDPEGQLIEFEITTPPTNGALSLADGSNTQELIFAPSSDLLPGITYEDQFTFQVHEVNTDESSELATVLFEFYLEDTQHEVIGLDKSSNTFTVNIADTVFNANYGIDVNYYNISDPLNSTLINIQNGSISKASMDIGTLSGSYSFEVDASTHSYLFTQDQVLVTVLVTTPDSYSSFNSFIIDNAAGGRILASEDGDYFVVGSDLSVPENKSVKVKMVAVDFAGFDAEPSIEWTKNPDEGVLSTPILIESSGNIRIWESNYTSTGDIGTTDDFSFRVFNPIRNSYESGDVTMTIQNVNDVPELSDIPDQQWAEDGTKSVTLAYSDPDNELAFDTESDNPDIMAEVVDGVLQLSSTAGYYGEASINVWVEEVGTTEEYLVLKQLDVEVTPVNDAPVLAAISNQTDDEDVTISVSLDATDADGDVILFSYYGSIDDPTLASISFSSSAVNIIPIANANGTATVTVVADDGSGAANALSNTVTFDVTFNAVNDDPILVDVPDDQQLVEDFPDYDMNMALYFDDEETDIASLTFGTSGNTNVGISFTGAVATISSVTLDWSGTETVTFTASDGGGNDASFSIDFIVEAESIIISENVAIGTISLDEDFGSAALDISSVFSSTNPAAVFSYEVVGNSLTTVSIDNMNETMTFGSKSNINGTETLLLIGSADGASKLHTFTVDVAAINDAPIITPVSTQSVNEDGTLSNVVIEVSDPENDVLTSFTVVSGDQSLVADGSIVIDYTFAPIYQVSLTPEAEQSGITTLTVTANDGTDNSQSSFLLSVSSVNDFPTVAGSLSDLNQEGNFSTDITTLFDDIDSETLNYEVESKPDWMTLNGDLLEGSPANEDVGIDQVTILVSDEGGSVRATFEFEIINVNDAPEVIQEAGSRLVYAGEAFSYGFPESNFKDKDIGDNLTYTIESIPSWLTDVGGTVSGTPTNTDVGQAEVVYRATDDNGLYVEDILTIDVSILTYDVTVSFTNSTSCLGGTSSVSASGAFDYKWYDENDQLLQDGGSTFESTTATSLYVVGVDGQSIETDSKFETSIEFNPLPDATLSQDEDVLKVADVSGYTYSWSLDDSNISEATGATYEPTESGSYQVVVVSDLGCSSTSNALDVTIVIPVETEEVLGLNDPSKEVLLFPVPAREYLTLRLPESWHKAQLSVVNMQGQEVFFQNQLSGAEVKIDLVDYQKGIYFVRLRVDGQQLNMKFIKE